MRKYKDTYLAKGSQVLEALNNNKKKEAEKIYKETTERAKKLYGKDYDWFMEHNK